MFDRYHILLMITSVICWASSFGMQTCGEDIVRRLSQCFEIEIHAKVASLIDDENRERDLLNDIEQIGRLDALDLEQQKRFALDWKSIVKSPVFQDADSEHERLWRVFIKMERCKNLAQSTLLRAEEECGQSILESEEECYCSILAVESTQRSNFSLQKSLDYIRVLIVSAMQ